MKYNLISSGIQQRDNENENTETVLNVIDRLNVIKEHLHIRV
jgi:hypothetical protein